MKSCKIVFFGNERLSTGYKPSGAPTLQRLIDAGFSVAAVVASHEMAVSRKKRELEVEHIAKQNNIPVLLPNKVKDIEQQLKDFAADIGILVAFGQMIPESIINIFPHGIINIHPSLLPRYRGPIPIEQAILDGANETGVSIMGLVKKMDAGPIFDQARVTLVGNESKQDLTEKLHKLGADLVIRSLPSILDGSAKSKSQNESEATYCQLLHKSDGVIDKQKPAIQLEREIRAFQEWPKSRANIFGKDVIIKSAHVATQKNEKDLFLECGQNSLLKIDQLVGPSGKQMSGTDFIKGYNKP
ncbi:MAG TPA: methionyl-tRNA formyltransferase [Candidatus Saccharimonadales bacterium]|nr:methionyl-tRNA formyltransferase [Candidatus Saccharimonadales bacterium]